MSHTVPASRSQVRAVATRLPAYAAFAVSFLFAAAIVLGFIG